MLMYVFYFNIFDKIYCMGFVICYVFSFVDIYFNIDYVYEYGGNILLDKFGCVIVVG